MKDSEVTRIADSLVVQPRVAPSGSLAYAVETEDGWLFGSGASGFRSASRPEPVTTETLYDLASVTKPFVACALARLVRAGRVRFDWPLSRCVPEAAATPSGPLPLELFAAHRAGLGAHEEFFAPLRQGLTVDPASIVARALRARRHDCQGLAPPSGFPPVYSDLGYLLLGVALERAADAPLDEVVREQVAGPLSLTVASARQFRAEAPERIAAVAPTEVVQFRGGEVTGAVHDENAWAFSGYGLAGHAGLFGTAESVARFGAALIGAVAGVLPDWLTRAEIEPLVRRRPGGSLRAGFDGKSDTGSSAGARAGPHTFGHLGYTGTSLWCDPDAQITVVALTNRVSPTRENWAIREARPRIHDALFAIASDRRLDRTSRNG